MNDAIFAIEKLRETIMKNTDKFQVKAPRSPKDQVSVLFLHLVVAFTLCLVASNILETKQILNSPIGLTGGLLVFPISYVINDIVAEVWGYRRASLLIWTGFVMMELFFILCALVDAVPGAPGWDNEAGFHAIFGLAPRIAIASCVAFVCGSFVNAYVMSRMKVRQQGRHFAVRAVMSSICGEACDSVIFFPLAFLGVLPTYLVLHMMVVQFILKTLYEVVLLPVTIRVIKWVKANEGVDVYDHDISYNILDIFRKKK